MVVREDVAVGGDDEILILAQEWPLHGEAACPKDFLLRTLVRREFYENSFDDGDTDGFAGVTD